jgi:hypothetical protein
LKTKALSFSTRLHGVTSQKKNTLLFSAIIPLILYYMLSFVHNERVVTAVLSVCIFMFTQYFIFLNYWSLNRRYTWHYVSFRSFTAFWFTKCLLKYKSILMRLQKSVILIYRSESKLRVKSSGL